MPGATSIVFPVVLGAWSSSTFQLLPMENDTMPQVY